MEVDLSKHSPQELQGYLIDLYRQFPYGMDNVKPIDQHETLERRDWSEHKALLIDRIKNLLGFSPTTNFFKRRLLEYLSLTYDSGRAEEVVPEVPLPIILDAELMSGGIFERQRAMEIERSEYRRLMHANSFFEATMVVEGSEIEKNRFHNEIRDWRQEFIEFYGEEP